MRTPVSAFLALIGLAIAAASCGGDAGTPPATDLGVEKPAVTATMGTEAAMGTEATNAPLAGAETPACPIEQSLAERVPCDCFGTLVTDVKTAYADCVAPASVICCPGRREPVCE